MQAYEFMPEEWAGITQSELGWVAGIIDGEGSLAIGFPSSSKTWYCSVSVRNTRVEMVNKLKELFGGKTFKTKYKPNNEGEYKPVWSWWINPSRIKTFLETIYPYLVVKKKQAELLIEMRYRIEERVGIEMVYRLNTKDPNRGHKSMHITDEERVVRNQIYLELKKYNRTGGER